MARARAGARGPAAEALVPVGQALALQATGGEGGVLARHGQPGPVAAGRAVTAQHQQAVTEAGDPDPVAAVARGGLDQDGAVLQDPGPVALA
jgi:hypothetical protein